MTSYMSSIKAKAALILLHTGSEVHSFARLQSFFLFYTGCFKKNKKKKKTRLISTQRLERSIFTCLCSVEEVQQMMHVCMSHCSAEAARGKESSFPPANAAFLFQLICLVQINK